MLIYEGPSAFDGSPIVAIATFGSRNRKTGPMPQIWILSADTAPHEAIRSGEDAAVCGSCPQRAGDGGACYVRTSDAPLSIWRKYKAGGYRRPSPFELRELANGPIRLGAYGDPAAVPYGVWEQILAEGCGRWSGYTHAWRGCDPAFKQIIMASCDSPAEALEAAAAGWRTFTVLPHDYEGPGLTGSVECLSESKGLTCERCTACDGTRGRESLAASIWIRAHGARKARYALPVLG